MLCFLLCLSSSCVPYISGFFGLSILDWYYLTFIYQTGLAYRRKITFSQRSCKVILELNGICCELLTIRRVLVTWREIEIRWYPYQVLRFPDTYTRPLFDRLVTNNFSTFLNQQVLNRSHDIVKHCWRWTPIADDKYILLTINTYCWW